MLPPGWGNQRIKAPAPDDEDQEERPRKVVAIKKAKPYKKRPKRARLPHTTSTKWYVEARVYGKWVRAGNPRKSMMAAQKYAQKIASTRMDVSGIRIVLAAETVMSTTILKGRPKWNRRTSF